MAETDGAMVHAAVAGDRDAFAELYRRYAHEVRRTVGRFVRGPEAGDLVQETFARAFERLSTLRDAERFAGWLMTIAKHIATDHCRRGGLHQFDEAPLDEVNDGAPLPDEMAEMKELATLFRGAVAGLSQRDATAVVLVTRLGFSIADLGTMLGVKPATARVVLHRAHQRLRDAVAASLLSRNEHAGCDGFHRAVEQGGVAPVRHIHDCLVCVESARHEVELYDAAHST